MRVYEFPDGRLGNLIFRYLASALFCIKYGATRGMFGERIPTTCSLIYMEDEDFLLWINSEELPAIEDNSIVIFRGYCQNHCFTKYRTELLEHMSKNAGDILVGHTPEKKMIQYRVGDLLLGGVGGAPPPPPPPPKYDIVIHLRLEDFLNDDLCAVTHPECLDELIQGIIKTESNLVAGGKICILCNAPRLEIEKLYIDYFCKRYAIAFESNDVVVDYKIMLGARVLVCSLSSLSWAAAVLSTRLEKVYIPRQKTSSLQVFDAPIENSVVYENRCCGESVLRAFFDIPLNRFPMEESNNAKRGGGEKMDGGFASAAAVKS
jgi:hypothetical protein